MLHNLNLKIIELVTMGSATIIKTQTFIERTVALITKKYSYLDLF